MERWRSHALLRFAAYMAALAALAMLSESLPALYKRVSDPLLRTVPLTRLEWVLHLLPAALVIVAAWLFLHARRFGQRPGHCRSCGYDLRATADGGRCPECGSPSRGHEWEKEKRSEDEEPEEKERGEET